MSKEKKKVVDFKKPESKFNENVDMLDADADTYKKIFTDIHELRSLIISLEEQKYDYTVMLSNLKVQISKLEKEIYVRYNLNPEKNYNIDYANKKISLVQNQ